ncbi:MAG TPA: twin-arginine translocation signal domain-containing protein [Chitinophagaceae bacterium]
MLTRRNFIKTSATGGAGLLAALHAGRSLAFNNTGSPAELYQLSESLLKQWAAALIKLQVTDQSRTDDYGGIWCPADNTVHGRVGDTIYPFFYLASRANDSRYTDAAVLLYRWMERRVSRPDGSWLNEPQPGSWLGTTVFSAIALGETLKHHGALMDASFKAEVTARLKKAGDFICNTFTIDYGNINYPITASYGLSLLGRLLDEPKFSAKGRELAHQALRFISAKDGFLYGEGDPYYQASKKGCYSVDLGYNVEESLPSLVMYGQLTQDEEVLQAVTRSLQTHLEFMLPDGGWDNSWGTRNYKWTYWGSRTSDGSQPAYALLAGRDPVFYKAALQNTRLMQQCTHDGLLNAGLHYPSLHIPPCVHHTFCHIKGLTTILEYGDATAKAPAQTLVLPREKIYGSRFFSDIQTLLVSKGDFRATITAYDREYKKTTNGHASGGALTMLWHPKTGPLLTASMNEYQLYEAGNMQPDSDPFSMPLTPRVELRTGGQLYMSISDLDATMAVNNEKHHIGDVVVYAQPKLVDKNQQSPASGDIRCRLSYVFTGNKVVFTFEYDKGPHDAEIKVIFPVIAASSDKVTVVNSKTLKIDKGSAVVQIVSSAGITIMPTTGGRVFNFVPGLEALPLSMEQNGLTIEMTVW